MKKKILIFSKYFGYNVGGAERSVLELLKQKEKEGFKIHVLLVDNIKTFNAKRMILPKSWEISFMKFKTDSIRFTYLQYFLNKKNIQREIKKFNPNEYILYSYGFYGIAAINAFKGETVYLVRDEYGLGWNNNYYKGLKKLLKEVYRLVEYPFYLKWKEELYNAIRKSKLIANSKFIANELRKISNSDVEIIYPQINKEQLLREWEKVDKNVKKGIVLIGDNVIKGNDIVKKLAKLFPDEIFYIFDRKYQKEKIENNIIYVPWQQKTVEVYKYAKLVLIPSRWYEAYPRVALEAKILGIPVLGSARGGIVEILNKNELIFEVENLEEWRIKVANVLKNIK